MEANIKEIKEIVNEILKIFVHKPWCIYPRIITQNELDIFAILNERVIRLSCRIWQDNYYNEPVERARLDIHFCTAGEEKGENLNISSQCSWHYKDDDIYLEKTDEYVLIEKVITHFYKINNYYKKMKQLAKESADISPGSPRARLNNEFYNKEWEI